MYDETLFGFEGRLPIGSIPWDNYWGWSPSGSCKTNPHSSLFQQDQPAYQRMASYVCRGCPVKAQCLKWSLETPETSGVWGGLTERERRLVAGLAHDGSWRVAVARHPWCPWCKSKVIDQISERRLQCSRCFFEWPGLLPTAKEPQQHLCQNEPPHP